MIVFGGKVLLSNVLFGEYCLEIATNFMMRKSEKLKQKLSEQISSG
tara:strand:- start:643 stop:780 length:138 start_codon:yes stop_codon:yes gene_type:complete